MEFEATTGKEAYYTQSFHESLASYINDNFHLVIKNKLSNFAEEYWHYDSITRQSEEEFVDSYLEWAERKGYHRGQDKAIQMQTLAKSPPYQSGQFTGTGRKISKRGPSSLRKIGYELCVV